MNLYTISYKYKLIHQYGQAIICAIDELHACQIVHNKFKIGPESSVVIIAVVAEKSNIIILGE